MSQIGSLFKFENLFSKGFGKDIAHDPSRLVTGIDPASTAVWNKALGQHKEPLVNQTGSPGEKYYTQANAQGMDTEPARGFHKVADTIAMMYGMQGIAGIGGGGEAAGGEAAGGEAGGGGNYSNIARAMMQSQKGGGMGGMGGGGQMAPVQFAQVPQQQPQQTSQDLMAWQQQQEEAQRQRQLIAQAQLGQQGTFV